MNKLFLSLVTLALIFVSCSKSEDESPNYIAELEEQLRTTDITAHPERRHFQNHPLPVGKSHVSILCIGNSYTMDAVRYVNAIMEGTDVPDTCYTVYLATQGSASLQTWWEKLNAKDTLDVYQLGKRNMTLTKSTLKDLFTRAWDIITLQQYSVYAINYGSFKPWLQNLVDSILTNCPNPNVTLAWQTAWSYSENYGPQMDPYERWLHISLAVQQMVMADGIDVLIPIGTAIQNARNSTLNTTGELTRDGTHLDMGIGCYIASCTWVQSLLGPVFGFSVQGNETTPSMPTTSDEALYTSHPVTAENRELCQRCAVAAVETPFCIAAGEWK